MKHKRIYNTITKPTYILLFGLLACISCNKTLKLPDAGTEKKIALLGELIANDSTYIRAGQSVPLISSSSLKFEILEGLDINIEDISGNNIALNGYSDDYAVTLYTLPFSSATKIKGGNTYTVTATHATLGIAKAVVQIPEPFTATIAGIENTVYANDSVIKINVQIEDPSATQNYYVIEALKQLMDVQGYFKYQGNWLSIVTNKALYDQLKTTGSLEEKFDTTYYKNYVRNLLFTSDPNTENLLTKTSIELNRRILLRDLTFNGQIHTTTLYIKRDYYDSLYSNQKGRVLLQVKSVPEQYFNYLKHYEEQTDQGGFNTFAQPLKVEGNVLNGVGVIGGVYKNEFIIRYDTWQF